MFFLLKDTQILGYFSDSHWISEFFHESEPDMRTKIELKFMLRIKSTSNDLSERYYSFVW